MAATLSAPGKPDFTQGVEFSELPDGGSLAGIVGEDEIILVRRGDTLYAVGAYCTHYHGSLADGLVVGDTVRCPLHHACFDLRTGRALRAPALDAINCWRVERIEGRVFVREKLTSPVVPPIDPSGLPLSVVIVGGGAAGLSAANTLRQEGYVGPITLVSADESPPVDRPNLSRTRGIDVHVAGLEAVPMERVLGADVGRFVQSLHESHGVRFHLGATVARMDGRQVTLTDGTTIDADFLVVGVGVRPSIDLATSAGLTLDRGVAVNEYLETSASGIFAAGDIARWPDPHSRERIRVEHWVVAERQRQVAARNILGRREKFAAVPFFWSQHYDVSSTMLAMRRRGTRSKWMAL